MYTEKVMDHSATREMLVKLITPTVSVKSGTPPAAIL